MTSKVNPYTVEGTIDYAKLVKEFGIGTIDKKLLARIKKHTKVLHPMLRRGIFFAHRDLNWLLDEYEKGNTFFLYTGCGPSGPVHLGHALVWEFVKWLQDAFEVELYFQFTDDEKFMYKKDLSYDDVQAWLAENMQDVIAFGFNPKKTHFIVDTKHAGIMYPHAIQVAKHITYSTVKSTFGFENSTNIGSIFYTAMQAVPAFLPSALAQRNIPCLIPHAVDQDPHFRITRDILPKLGYFKPASIQCSFLPPLSGQQGKMSSSDAAKGILLSDSPAQVKKKINKHAHSGGQLTIEEHRKKGGNPEVDVAFQYLKYLFEDDDVKLAELEAQYRSGELLSGELKAYAIDKINAYLANIQQRRLTAKKHIPQFLLNIKE